MEKYHTAHREVGESVTCISAGLIFPGDPGAMLPPQLGHGWPDAVTEIEKEPFLLGGEEGIWESWK